MRQHYYKNQERTLVLLRSILYCPGLTEGNKVLNSYLEVPFDHVPLSVNRRGSHLFIHTTSIPKFRTRQGTTEIERSSSLLLEPSTMMLLYATRLLLQRE